MGGLYMQNPKAITGNRLRSDSQEKTLLLTDHIFSLLGTLFDSLPVLPPLSSEIRF